MESTKTKSTLRKKLKGSIRKLNSRRDELKERRGELEKKIEKLCSKNGKKAKRKGLKVELKKLSKKEDKLISNLESHKSKLLKLKEKKAKESKKKKLKHKVVKNTPIADKEDLNALTIKASEVVSDSFKDQFNSSIDYNAKQAIAILRKITDLQVLGEFISKETRLTVGSAAKSRRNAIIREDPQKERT